MRLLQTIGWLWLLCMLTGCTSQPHHVRMSKELPSIYPDYVDVTIPVGIAPLNFSMADDEVTTVDVTIRGSKTGSMHVNGDYADLDIDEWHQLLEHNKGGKLQVTVVAEKNGQWTSYLPFNIFVSRYPLDEWGITYRRIPPSYKIYSKMGIYERDLSTFEETILYENSPASGMCVNCHTANRTSPDQYVYHLRGPQGATVIHRGGKDDFLKGRNDSIGGSMVYPYWHPNGRYCAFSTNKTAQMFHLTNNKRIEVYDTQSDVFVYDTETRQVIKDTLIMRADWAENCPAFSSDGKWLYFVTARQQTYPTGYDKQKYSLCRVAFHAETGKFGKQVDTLIHAQDIGKSVTWPRPSYDGRYLMYTTLYYGYFSIWHPEADLWLLDLQKGETRPMNEVNSQRAESFHNWSTNSHWFLFTSRRENGLYTQIFFSSMENGTATKPFLLPQRNPKVYYRRSLYSFNTPDFTNKKVKK